MRDDLEIIARRAAKRLGGWEEDGGSLYDFQSLADFVLSVSLPQRAIAARFGITHGIVGNIRRGTDWKHVV
jgi:hypothetical protein